MSRRSAFWYRYDDFAPKYSEITVVSLTRTKNRSELKRLMFCVLTYNFADVALFLLAVSDKLLLLTGMFSATISCELLLWGFITYNEADNVTWFHLMGPLGRLAKKSYPDLIKLSPTYLLIYLGT